MKSSNQEFNIAALKEYAGAWLAQEALRKAAGVSDDWKIVLSAQVAKGEKIVNISIRKQASFDPAAPVYGLQATTGAGCVITDLRGLDNDSAFKEFAAELEAWEGQGFAYVSQNN